jgi:hypothetical protein
MYTSCWIQVHYDMWQGVKESLQKTNQTWTLVDLSIGCFQVLTKWLFKIKHELESTILKYKACLVARRFEQQ